jgi:uncharacterized protein with HEPN domain
MPPERDLGYVWDMLKAARGVVASLQGISFAQYMKDEDIRLATERRIEIIGEAARRVSASFKEVHPEIPWRLIVDQRNVLIHSYDEIEEERIWHLVGQEIPVLIDQLTSLIPPTAENG